jgi:hypothetical protein
VAVRGPRANRRRGHGLGSLASDWPQMVSALGCWLRQQADRGGPVGGAACVAVTVVNRAAEIAGAVSAEVLRATSSEANSGPAGRRRGQRRKGGSKPASARRTKTRG